MSSLKWIEYVAFLLCVLTTTANSQDSLALQGFSNQTLTSTYYSEGVAVGDLNQDGQNDIVYGPYWFVGPAFTQKYELYPAVAQPMEKYADHFFAWVYDFDNDGNNDVLTVGFPGTPAYVLHNPGKRNREKHWEKIEVFDWVSNESPQWTNLVGDEKPELVCTRDGFFGFASIDWTQPFKKWTFHPISERIAPEKFGHGLGIGDVNHDGRMDILRAAGWFEQPDTNPESKRWREHRAKFTSAGGGAEMYAYDVDGDGDNDVITSLAAHEFGLSWFEQVRNDNDIEFKEHKIMGSRRAENKYGVLFSELHSVALADMDGDGLKDIVTGKTYYSHHKKSPMWDAGAVVYWFKLVRSKDGVDWLPYQADGTAGIGRQVVVDDINRDGAMDIATGGMLGAHVLMQNKKAVDRATWQAAQPRIFDPATDVEVIQATASDSKISDPLSTQAQARRANSLPGVIEGEHLDAKVTAGSVKSQVMSNFKADRWSGNSQLWWTGGKTGSRLSAEFEVADQRKYLHVVLTKAKNYGIVRMMVDDRTMAEQIDLFSPDVKTTGVLVYDATELKVGKHTMAVEIVGSNPNAQPAFMVGIDYLRLTNEVAQPANKTTASNDMQAPRMETAEVLPAALDGHVVNLDFESGDLRDWTATGNAFIGQPIEGDVIAQRRSDMKSQHRGNRWIGTFEKSGDPATGTLTSLPFKASERYASFLIGGGQSIETRVELWGVRERIPFFQVTGKQHENMTQVVVDLRRVQDREMFIRIVDEAKNGWGHINFDHFRLHRDKPGELTAPSVALAADQYPFQGLDAESAAKAMQVPDGFRVTVCAAEPDVQQPIAMAFDDRGRVWIAEAYEYPIRSMKAQGRDRILIFEDRDGDGKFDSRKIFAEGLNLVSGLEVGFGGVWVGAAPYLMFIPDQNQDDQPDGEPKILLDGWGYQDTHETLNAFNWGPDGWLYGCHGVFTHSRVGKPDAPDADRIPMNAGVWRYHPIHHQFEVFAHGTSNPWGVDFNETGDAFITACVIPHLFHMIPGARYHRQGGQHFNPHTYDDIRTIADHLHYLGTTPHSGNGKSDEVGGGHAHCGAMIYQGGAWPKEYHQALFMNNIHGQRINIDHLKLKGSGYVGTHGHDFLKTQDMASQIINMAYGPDGQVTMIDWYDMQACHSKDPNKHDRKNGRIYKVSYGDTKWATVDLSQSTDLELVEYCLCDNDWYVRHARRLMQERFASGKPINQVALDRLKTLATTEESVAKRLRAAWALFVVEKADAEVLKSLAADSHASSRAWAIRLAFDQPNQRVLANDLWLKLANDASPVVRLSLASSLQKLPAPERWPLIQKFPVRSEDANDHNLPLMIWYAVEPMADVDPEKIIAWSFAAGEHIPRIRDFMLRRVAGQGGEESIDRMVALLLNDQPDAIRLSILKAVQSSLVGQRSARKPNNWDAVYTILTQNSNDVVKLTATALGVTFGDESALNALRRIAADSRQNFDSRIEALNSLISAKDRELPSVLLAILREPGLTSSPLRLAAIRGLGQYDQPEIAASLIESYGSLAPTEKNAAMATLCGRSNSAVALLKAIREKSIPTGDLSADLARQLEYLDDPMVRELLDKVWGQVRKSPAEKVALIQKYKNLASETDTTPPDVNLGRAIFSKTCQRCHALYAVGQHIGPDLTGSNRSNLDYLLENIVDPSAVMANEYRQTIIRTEDGQIVTGILKSETEKSISIQTADALVTLPKAEIEERKVSEKSMMPEDQLQPFASHEIRSLIAYLRDTKQSPMLLSAENSKDFFNGRDLTGWSGNPDLWRVENGEIVGKSQGLKRNEFLISDSLAGDFTLTLEMKLVDNIGNSGIQFRSRQIEGGLVQGYQADAGPGWWGKLYEEHGRKLLWEKSGEAHVKKGDWNTYTIEAKGFHIKTSINDQPCVDLEDPDGQRRGVFAFQLHSGGPTEVRLKNIQLRIP
jgi:putative membrane-bound dehydrogenase-like protein